MKEWEKLDDVSQNIKDEPWSLYWTEYKTGTEEFEEFLHDPLSDFTQTMEGVDRSWSVLTNIIGHEIGLKNQAVCSLGMVDSECKFRLN